MFLKNKPSAATVQSITTTVIRYPKKWPYSIGYATLKISKFDFGLRKSEVCLSIFKMGNCDISIFQKTSFLDVVHKRSTLQSPDFYELREPLHLILDMLVYEDLDLSYKFVGERIQF